MLLAPPQRSTSAGYEFITYHAMVYKPGPTMFCVHDRVFIAGHGQCTSLSCRPPSAVMSTDGMAGRILALSVFGNKKMAVLMPETVPHGETPIAFQVGVWKLPAPQTDADGLRALQSMGEADLKRDLQRAQAALQLYHKKHRERVHVKQEAPPDPSEVPSVNLRKRPRRKVRFCPP